jgi:hypothetical protein
MVSTPPASASLEEPRWAGCNAGSSTDMDQCWRALQAGSDKADFTAKVFGVGLSTKDAATNHRIVWCEGLEQSRG